MALPTQFLTRFAIPFIVAALSSMDDSAIKQAKLFDQTLQEGDRILRLARREGEGPTESYDFIVVGAGAAGSLLANRLSANGTYQILLLDLGGDPNPLTEVPVLREAAYDTSMTKNYATVRQSGMCLNANGTCLIGRGIGLGGTTQINGVFWNRCHPQDYNSWAEFTGDDVWRFSNVVEAFKKIEKYEGNYEDNPGPNHGTDGEMVISKRDYVPGAEVLEEALREKGFPLVDLNSGEHDWGFMRPEYALKDGLRNGAYQAFLQDILGVRPNLKVYRYARAQRIVLDQNNRAIGLIYRRHGVERYAQARREVIISTGVIDTPKLLMLSGIGPRDHLTTLGIQTLVDLLNVGSNTQDHAIAALLPPFVINQTFSLAELNTPSTILQYIENGTGPIDRLTWGYPNGITIMNSHLSSKIWDNPSHPDLQATVGSALANNTVTGNPEQVIWFDMFLALSNQTGTIRLASQDPEVDPLIDPKLLQDYPEDLEKIIDGIEIFLDLFLNSTTFRGLGIRWMEGTDGREEKCEHLPFATRAYWRCWIPQRAISGPHSSSSCRMGPDDRLGCVDSRLRVFNTTGLRVIDSSVMPFVPIGNTMAPTMMIAEMGSKFILDDHRNRKLIQEGQGHEAGHVDL